MQSVMIKKIKSVVTKIKFDPNPNDQNYNYS